MGGKILRVQMLGKFTMRYGEDRILFHKTGNAKSVRLLQMLLLSGEQGIAKSEIMDFLYGWSEVTDAGNRNKNLNNLCYRLKGQLAASGLPEEEYVVIQDGYAVGRAVLRLNWMQPILKRWSIRQRGARAGNGPRCSFRPIRAITESCFPCTSPICGSMRRVSLLSAFMKRRSGSWSRHLKPIMTTRTC